MMVHWAATSFAKFLQNIDKAQKVAVGFRLISSWQRWGTEWAGNDFRLQNRPHMTEGLPEGTTPPGEACALGSARGPGGCPASHPQHFSWPHERRQSRALGLPLPRPGLSPSFHQWCMHRVYLLYAPFLYWAQF